MYLKRLYLRNFRNYAESEVLLSEHLNVFTGENAQGKTNILEAIYFISTGRSFRTSRLNELIRDTENYFVLEAEIFRDGVLQNIYISFDGQNKRLRIDGHSYPSFAPLLGLLPSVLYTPQDTEMISGAPNVRRQFLNFQLAQSDPLYVHHLTRYWRAMKQRNCLLKNRQLMGVDLWEEEMVSSASYLWKSRFQMMEELKTPLQEHGQRLSEKKEVHAMKLQAKADNYREMLEKNRQKEMTLGFTLTGPHRDELFFFINEKNARLFASEGQKKTAVASVKFAEWERLSKQTGAPALMGIDDLGLHLDAVRLNHLKKHLLHLGQVFITTPDLQIDQGLLLRVEEGKISSS